MTQSWWRKLVNKKAQASKRPLRRKTSMRLALEYLEDRVVPATHLWTGGGATGAWTDTNNWTNGSPQFDGSGDVILQFPANALNTTGGINDITGLQVASMEFVGNANLTTGAVTGPGSTTYNISGNAITFTNNTALTNASVILIDGGGDQANDSVTIGVAGLTLPTGNFSFETDSDTGNLTVSGPIALTNTTLSSRTDGSTTSSQITLSGQITGSGNPGNGNNALEIVGNGGTSTTLSGNDNTYTGITGVTDGATLVVTQPGALGDATGGFTTNDTRILGGGTLQLANAGGMTIDEPLEFVGGTLENAVGNNTYGGTIGLNSSGTGGTFQVDDGTSLLVTGVISMVSSTGSITGLNKTGSGLLEFASNNTYTVPTNVDAGTLQIDARTSLGTNTANVFGGATLAINGNLTVANHLTLTGTQAVPANLSDIGSTPNTSPVGITHLTGGIGIDGFANINVVSPNEHTLSVDGVISNLTNPGNIVKTGPGKLLITNDNTYTGNDTFTQGIVQTTTFDALGNTAGQTTDILGGAGLQLNFGGTHTLAQTMILNGANGSVSVPVAADGVTPNASGNLEDFDTSGTLTIPGLVLNGIPVSWVAVHEGAALNVNGIVSGTGGLSLNHTFSIDTANVTLTGDLIFSGGADNTPADNNTYAGATFVNDGTLELDKGANDVAVPGALTIGDGTPFEPDTDFVVVDTTGQFAGTNAVTIKNDGELFYNTNFGVGDQLQESIGTLSIVAGLPNQTFKGFSVFTGNIYGGLGNDPDQVGVLTVTGGVINVTPNAADGSVFTRIEGVVNLENATTITITNPPGAGVLTILDMQGVFQGAALTVTGGPTVPANGGGELVLDYGGFAGEQSPNDYASLTVINSATVLASTPVQYTGLFENPGRDEYMNFGVLSGPLTIGLPAGQDSPGTGGTVRIADQFPFVNEPNNPADVTVNPGGLLTIQNGQTANVASLTLNSDGIGGTAIVQTGNQSVIQLAGEFPDGQTQNTLTGAIIGLPGLPSVGAGFIDAPLGSSAITGSGMLDLNGQTGNNPTTRAINVTDGGVLTIFANIVDNGNDANAAAITVGAGDNQVPNTATGLLVLNGNNTGLFGTTTLEGGSFTYVNGFEGNSPVLVDGAGTTLGGIGTVGTVDVFGGTIAPGGEGVVGTLSVLGNVTWHSNFDVDIFGTSSGDFDRLNISGTATIAPGTTLEAFTTPAGFPFGDQFTVLQAQGGITGTFSLVGGGFTIEYLGNNGAGLPTQVVLVSQNILGTAITAPSVSAVVLPPFLGETITLTSLVTVPNNPSANPLGTVTFSIDGTPLPAVPVQAGVATITVTNPNLLTVGDHTLTATFNATPNTGFSNSESPTNPLDIVTVTPTNLTTFSVTAVPPVIPQNGTVTLTATVGGPSGLPLPNGTVTFFDNGNAIAGSATGVTPAAGNVATATFLDSTLSPGNHVITAAYSGDTNYNDTNSFGNGAPVLVSAATTVSTPTELPANPVLGQPVTFSSSVSTVTPGAGTPTGSLTFTIDPGTADSITLNPVGLVAGHASEIFTGIVPVGQHQVIASYTPENNQFLPSTSTTPLVYTVGPTTVTTFTVGASPLVVAQGGTVTLTASITGPAGLPLPNGGTVTFLDNGSPIATATLANGLASTTVTTLGIIPPANVISATYSGDTNFQAASSSDSVTVTVQAPTTTAQPTATPASPAALQPITFTTSVTSANNETPTGFVTFTITPTAGSPITLGPVLLVGGSASPVLTSGLTAGTYSVTAEYTPSNPSTGDFLASPPSAPLDLTVSLETTTTATPAATPASPVLGQNITFTTSVTAPVGTPTGTVVFSIDGTNQPAVPVVAGQATDVFTGLLAVGQHSVTATYTPDTAGSNVFKSSSSATPLVINVGSASLAAFTVSSSPTSQVFGQPVILTATTTPPAGLPTPTGTVTFFDTFNSNTTTLGTGTLVAGLATFNDSTLPVGNHTITARFNSADTNYVSGEVTPNGSAVVITDLSASQRLLDLDYNDLLGRAPDSSGSQFFGGQLAAGVSNAVVSAEMQSTSEYRDDVVNNSFQTILGRQADPTALVTFSNLLASGTTIEQMNAILFGSQEFLTKSGGTNTTFLQQLYLNKFGLNRAIDPVGQAAFTQALNNGVSRQQVASIVVTSLEGEENAVNNIFEHFLRRSADAQAEAGFGSALANGSLTDQQVIAIVMGSPEYGNLAGTLPEPL